MRVAFVKKERCACCVCLGLILRSSCVATRVLVTDGHICKAELYGTRRVRLVPLA